MLVLIKFRCNDWGKLNLDTKLTLLESAQLVRRVEGEEDLYIFKHALTQESAYESLLHAQRRLLHRYVAQAYEAEYGDCCLDEYAAILAQHYTQAGDDAQVLVYATRAGDQSAHLYANCEAVEFYTQALMIGGHRASPEQLQHLYTARGRAYELANQPEQALANYLEMEQIGRTRGYRPLELASLILQATIHATLTPLYDTQQAQQLCDTALVLARELDDRVAQAKIFWNLLLLNTQARRILQAIDYGEQSLALARELGLREQVAFTLNDLARAYVATGQVTRADQALEQARRLWHSLDNQPMLTDNLMMSATVSLLTGAFDRSLALSEQGRQLGRKIGNVVGEFSSVGPLVNVLSERGEFARALELIDSALPQLNGLPALGLMRSIRGWLLATLGEFRPAREMAQRAQEALERPVPPFFHKWALAYLVRLHVLCNDLTDAAQALEQMQAEQHTADFEPGGLLGPIAQAELAMARGNFSQAVTDMQALEAHLRPANIHLALYQALFLQAEGLRALGKNAQALELLQEARVEAEALHARRLLWQIYADLSAIENELGHLGEAERLRAQARDVIAYIVANSPEEFRESFTNLPRVGAVVAAK